MEQVRKRESNFEWLRVLAMCMIITAHYMFKGDILNSFSTDTSFTNWTMWIIAAFSVCSLNIYVFISAFFLIDKIDTRFKLKRVLEIIVQVLEYSLILAVIMIATGQVSLSSLTVYDWFVMVFPIGSEEYWFVTAYVIMYLFAPVLAAGVKAVDEKTLRTIILALLVFTSVEKTIFPMLIPIDDYGYSFGWFLVLFLVAAYMKLYGIKFLEGHIGRSWVLLGGSVAVQVIVGSLGSIIGVKTGIESLISYSKSIWDLNYLFVFVASVALFYIFKNARFNDDSKLADIGRLLGGLTFGVYLVHEHPLIRYRWLGWLHVVRETKSFGYVFGHLILSVVVLFVVGALAEYIRSSVVRFVRSKRIS